MDFSQWSQQKELLRALLQLSTSTIIWGWIWNNHPHQWPQKQEIQVTRFSSAVASKPYLRSSETGPQLNHRLPRGRSSCSVDVSHPDDPVAA